MILTILILITFIARIFNIIYDFKDKNYKMATINAFFAGIFLGLLICSLII